MKNSTDIGSLQKFILDAIRRPLDAEMRIDENAKLGKLAEKFLLPTDKLSSLQRLEIYNQQYWYRMLDSLEEDFPALCKIIGKDEFRRLSVEYINNNPSRTHFLSDLGCDMHKYVATNSGGMEIKEPVNVRMCLDVISVEWAQIHAFDAEEKAPASPAGKNSQELFQIEFRLQPHISLLKLSYDVREFILQLKDSGSKIAYPSAKTNYLAVHRHENQVYMKELTKEASTMLEAIQDGASIENCIERVLEENEHLDVGILAQSVQEHFASWIRLGWLCSKV